MYVIKWDMEFVRLFLAHKTTILSGNAPGSTKHNTKSSAIQYGGDRLITLINVARRVPDLERIADNHFGPLGIKYEMEVYPNWFAIILLLTLIW